MSPKNSSLAYDDVSEQTQEASPGFEPQLNLIVNGRTVPFMDSLSGMETEVIQVRGRITISF